MKKIIALILALILCFAVAGCSITKKDNDAAVSTADESKATEVAETSAPSADKGNKQYASVEEYISDPAVSKSLDSANDSFGDKVTFAYHAEGDKLVYDYTYTEYYNETALTTIRTALESSLEKNADSFNQVVDVLKKTVNVAEPKLEVNYHNNDGSIIASRTFG